METLVALRIVETLRQIGLFGAVFASIELAFAFYPRATLRRHRLADLEHGLFNAVIMRLPLILLVLGATVASGALLPKTYLALVSAQPLAVQVIEVALLFDFGIYFAHRALHSPALWRIHSVHHSAEDMDWLVSFRVHPLELLLLESAALLPAVLLGFPLAAIGIQAVLYGWMSVLNHANVGLSLGPLRRWIVGPEFHHWHHARDGEAHDRNFAAQFVLWDRLFGTLFLPAGRRPAGFGIEEAMPPRFADQLAYPFRAKRSASNAVDAEAIARKPLKASTP